MEVVLVAQVSFFVFLPVLRFPEQRAAHDKELQTLEMCQQVEVRVSQSVDLEQFECQEHGETIEYSHECRCGGTFVVLPTDLLQGKDVVGCCTCSLHIRVLFDPTDLIGDDDEDEDCDRDDSLQSTTHGEKKELREKNEFNERERL